MLNSIKQVLGMEVKLEQMTLENGTIFEAESFEVGQEVFIVTDDEKVAVPVPAGEYELQDGNIIVVNENGEIAEMGAKEEEAPEEEVKEEVEVEAKDEEKEEMGYATKEELAEVKEMIEEIKAMLEPKEEMSKEIEVIAEEVVEQVKEELSQPAVEPLTHNPEANTKNKVEVKYSKNRKMSTLDRVLNKLNN